MCTFCTHSVHVYKMILSNKLHLTFELKQQKTKRKQQEKEKKNHTSQSDLLNSSKSASILESELRE